MIKKRGFSYLRNLCSVACSPYLIFLAGPVSHPGRNFRQEFRNEVPVQRKRLIIGMQNWRTSAWRWQLQLWEWMSDSNQREEKRTPGVDLCQLLCLESEKWRENSKWNIRKYQKIGKTSIFHLAVAWLFFHISTWNVCIVFSYIDKIRGIFSDHFPLQTMLAENIYEFVNIVVQIHS